MFKGLLKTLWLASTRTSPPPALRGGADRQEHRSLQASRLHRRREACIDQTAFSSILAIHATTPNVHRGDYKPRGLSCQVCYLCTWGSCGSWGRSSGLGVIPTHTRISDIKWISIVSVIRRAMKSAARIRLASSFPDSSILDPPMTRSPTCPSARTLSNGHQNDLQPAAEPHACCCSTAHHPRHSSASQLSDRP